MTRHITALEHESVPIREAPTSGSITPDEAEVLMQLNESRPGFCERGYRTVRLAQFCGVINIGQRALEVLPKIGERRSVMESRGVLLRLLRAAGMRNGFQPPPAAQHFERWPLLEMFIALFMDEVARVLRGGLLRQYQEQEDDLRVVRGRIILTRQFGVHFNRPDVIASRFDDHTTDNVWNRAVKAALRKARPWITSGDLDRQWIELMAAMDDIADVPVRARELDRLVYDRQAVRYRNVMQWVRWILSLLSPTLRAGVDPAPAFLFDMNAVFERAVANALRRHLAAIDPTLVVHEQVTERSFATLNGRPAFDLRPDIVVTRGRDVVLIADTKWKRYDITSGHVKPSREDMYQMNAYASAFNVERLALIYPWDPDRKARETAYRLPSCGERDRRVEVMCLDVRNEWLALRIGNTPLLSAGAAATGS